jgi:polyhydroxyalkanoate synthesis regulator phasin
MAKSKKKEQKKESSRTKVQKIAREAGKIAAQAERIARDAVDKAVQASSMVVDVIGHPSHAADAIGSAMTAGRKTAAELGTRSQGLLESGATASSDLVEKLSQMVDDRLHLAVKSLGLASRTEVDALKRRIAELEGDGARKALPAKRAAKKPAAKPAAKRAPKAAAKPAARKTAARKPASRKPATAAS